jgi:5-carboxymethyl-2-hydroxymuconate isomerase
VPHLTIEYSASLEARADINGVCEKAYKAMLTAGIFPKAGIRVRAHKADVAIVGDALPENDFAALTLSVGAGRTTEALKTAGDIIFAAVQEALKGPLSTPHFALSLEIREINTELSWKDTPIHARLSGKR